MWLNGALGFLMALGVSGRTITDNVDSNRVEAVSPTGDLDWERYPSYDEIMAYLEKQAKLHPEFVRLTNQGHTEEGRKLMLIKIGISPKGESTPAMWLDSGIHAREWIAHTSGLYVVDRLIKEFSKDDNDPSRDPSVTSTDWYIMPLLNPDGYEYSRTTDRNWRKNRAAPQVAGTNCYGVDLNRNYDAPGFGVGASTDQCMENYRGLAPNTEPEVRAASAVVLAHKDTLRASVSLHSAGNLILTSWGYTRDVPPDNDQLIKIADATSDAIAAVNGRKYKVERACGLYPAGGASDDFAKAAGVPFAVTIELPGGEGPGNHFKTPESDIKPVGEEMWVAMKKINVLA